MTTKRKTYPGALDKRGNSYRWRVCVGGKRHTFLFRTANQKEAERVARSEFAILSKHADRERQGLPGRVTVSALFDQFEREKLPGLSDGTKRSYGDSLKPLRTYFVDERDNPNVDEIRAGDIDAYMTWRRSHRVGGGTVSNRTIAKDRAVLHAIFDMAEIREYRDGNPVGRTKPPKYDGRDPVMISEEEYDRLLEACGDQEMLRLYILALGETGGRCESEVLWTTWDDVDLKEAFLWIASGRNGHRTKSGKGRWVPMSPRLCDAMRDHFARYRLTAYDGKPTPWIFHHSVTRRRYQAGDRIRSLYRSFKSAAARAKLPPELVQHDLRHRRVTAWLAAGKNPVHVKEAVGHADLRTTMAYTHLAREHLRSLVDQEPQREELRDLA